MNQTGLFDARVDRKKPLLVGEDNPYGSDPQYALYPRPLNASGDRLARKVMGLTAREYLRRFDRVNLCAGKWSAKEASRRAGELVREGRDVYVLLGAKVARAFGATTFEPFTSRTLNVWGPKAKVVDPPSSSQTVIFLPHPSGRCTLWNVAGAFDRARDLLVKFGVLEAPGECPEHGDALVLGR